MTLRGGQHRIVLGIAAAAALWAMWFGTRQSPAAPAEIKMAPAVVVDAATVGRADVPVYLQGLGTVQANYTVTVLSLIHI